jgi:hypothetical protein
MINGIAPILIFHFWNLEPSVKTEKTVDGTAETEVKTAWLTRALDYVKGLPSLVVPIYLAESSGTGWVSHDISIDIGEENINNEKYQYPIKNTVNIELIFRNDIQIPTPFDGIGATQIKPASPIMLLMPLLNLCWQRLASKSYAISYYNRDIIIKEGKLSSLQQSSDADTTLSKLNFTLSRDEGSDDDEKKDTMSFAEKITTGAGGTPVITG